MRIGISVTSRHTGLDDRGVVNTVIGRARAAAAAGLDHLSLGDQHSTGNSAPYVANVPMIGRIMTEWPPDRSIGLLLLLPLWHPVIAAEQIGTLAAMSDARFIVQTGIGHGKSQFAALGADHSKRGQTTDSSIRVIKQLLDGQTVDAPEFNISGAAVSPRPMQPVEWWIGAGTAPAALDRAAREGDAWYVGPGLDGPALTQAVEHYREACDRHGTKPAIVLRRDVLVGDDHAQTVATAKTVIESGYRGMDSQIIAGDSEFVAAKLSAYKELGIDTIAARTLTVDEPMALRSIELLGAVRLRL